MSEGAWVLIALLVFILLAFAIWMAAVVRLAELKSKEGK